MKVIGLISGTSLDGIDAALVEITGRGPSLKLIAYKVYPYPRGLRERLLTLPKRKETVGEISDLNFSLGELFAQAALRIARKAGLTPHDIDLIGSHGQTVYHRPGISTLQIGEASVIAERTGITTVADFRPRDIAAGGQGAPLSPSLHDLLFRHSHKARLVINIGGISNVTYLPAGKGHDDVIAFDAGPGNMLIDGIMERRSGGRRTMDVGGRVAGGGKVHEGFRDRLLRHPFLRLAPPKTTGREAFGKHFVERLLQSARRLRLSEKDLLATVTDFTAQAIALNVRQFLPFDGISEVIVGGGGVKNPVLMRRLREAMHPLPVMTYEDYRLPSKAIEAMAFALLAYETFHGRPGNIPRVTGARRPVVLGKIIPGR